MRLSLISGSPTQGNKNSLILNCFMSLVGLDEVISEGEVPGPIWPASLSDALFVPPRQFDMRKRARKFLSHLRSLGVPVDDWIGQIERPLGQEGEQIPAPKSGMGFTGRAYFIDDYVVKFTTDQTEARVAAHLMGKNVPFIAQIHGVWLVNELGYKRPIYTIVMEKLNTGVSTKYRIAGEAVYEFLDKFDRPIDDPKKVTEIAIQKFLPKKFRNDKSVALAIFKLFSALKAIYDATGVLLQDPHGGNLAFKDRDISFFDFGRSSQSPDVKLPDVEVR